MVRVRDVRVLRELSDSCSGIGLITAVKFWPGSENDFFGGCSFSRKD